jgi:hypothetical protein
VGEYEEIPCSLMVMGGTMAPFTSTVSWSTESIGCVLFRALRFKCTFTSVIN